MTIKTGDKVPTFVLNDQDGKAWDLKDHLGKKVLVVYFYPKDDTPICTMEAGAFRDKYEQFLNLGAEVVGISGDDQRSHQQFALKNKLPFRILSDAEDSVRKLYGASSLIGPGRVTYVIDKEGLVRHVFSSRMQAAKHMEEALQVVEGLVKG